MAFQLGLPDELPAGSRPGWWGSVIPAVWSFMLALRARGMGSVWTTMTCRKADEVAAVLGVPTGSTRHIGMFPVAYTIGTDFKPAPRVDPAAGHPLEPLVERLVGIRDRGRGGRRDGLTCHRL